MSKYYRILSTLIFRGAGALFSIVAIYLVLNTVNEKHSSEYFVALNAITFLSMICSLGLGVYLTRMISVSDSKVEVKGYSLGVFNRLVVFLFFFLLLYYFARDEAAEYFEKPVISDFYFYISFCVVVWAFLQVYSGALIGFRKATLAAIVQNILPYIFIISVCSIGYFHNLNLTAETILLLLILGISFGLFCSLALTLKFAKEIPEGENKPVEFKGVSHYTYAHITQYLLFSGITFINMRHVSSLDVAAIYSMQKVIGVITLLLIVINMVASPYFAKYWREGSLDKLKDVVVFYSRVSFYFCLPLFIMLVIFSEKILTFFSSSFVSYVNEFRVMLVGVFFSVVFGPVTVLLQMIGSVKIVSKINSLLVLPVLSASYVITREYGAIGLSVSISFLFFIQNFILVLNVKKRLGYFPILGR